MLSIRPAPALARSSAACSQRSVAAGKPERTREGSPPRSDCQGCEMRSVASSRFSPSRRASRSRADRGRPLRCGACYSRRNIAAWPNLLWPCAGHQDRKPPEWKPDRTELRPAYLGEFLLLHVLSSPRSRKSHHQCRPAQSIFPGI